MPFCNLISTKECSEAISAIKVTLFATASYRRANVAGTSIGANERKLAIIAFLRCSLQQTAK